MDDGTTTESSNAASDPVIRVTIPRASTGWSLEECRAFARPIGSANGKKNRSHLEDLCLFHKGPFLVGRGPRLECPPRTQAHNLRKIGRDLREIASDLATVAGDLAKIAWGIGESRGILRDSRASVRGSRATVRRSAAIFACSRATSRWFPGYFAKIAGEPSEDRLRLDEGCGQPSEGFARSGDGPADPTKERERKTLTLTKSTSLLSILALGRPENALHHGLAE
jgi:hypothetical protein